MCVEIKQLVDVVSINMDITDSDIEWTKKSVVARIRLYLLMAKSKLRPKWITIENMPIHFWCEETFKKIKNLWGKVIKVSSSTYALQNFEFARMLVLIEEGRRSP